MILNVDGRRLCKWRELGPSCKLHKWVVEGELMPQISELIRLQEPISMSLRLAVRLMRLAMNPQASVLERSLRLA